MTGENPDQDSASMSSNDSLFDIPPLQRRGYDDSSSDEEDSYADVPALHRRGGSVSPSDEGSLVSSNDNSSVVSASLHRPVSSRAQHQPEVETVTSDSLYETACDDDCSISSTESFFPSTFDDVGPPPPGSLMDLWDTPFSTNHFRNLASPLGDAKCTTVGSNTSDTDSCTDSSVEYANDDDTYAELYPLEPHPVLSLTRVSTILFNWLALNLLKHLLSHQSLHTQRAN
jgi:hypothetical protein